MIPRNDCKPAAEKESFHTGSVVADSTVDSADKSTREAAYWIGAAPSQEQPEAEHHAYSYSSVHKVIPSTDCDSRQSRVSYDVYSRGTPPIAHSSTVPRTAGRSCTSSDRSRGGCRHRLLHLSTSPATCRRHSCMAFWIPLHYCLDVLVWPSSCLLHQMSCSLKNAHR